MPLRVEVEGVNFLASGDYQAIVRAIRYTEKLVSENIGGASIKSVKHENLETAAEFTIEVSRIVQRKRRTERPIDEIKVEAKSEVVRLCHEIIKNLEG
jgi:hypothetical protein